MIIILILFAVVYAQSDSDKIDSLESKIQALEKRVEDNYKVITVLCMLNKEKIGATLKEIEEAENFEELVNKKQEKIKEAIYKEL